MLRLWTGQRCCRYFQRCLSSTLSRRYTRKKEHYDVVIAGGGIMGCSSAYFLAQRVPPESVCIIERDPKYEKASTVLSVGSIRQQFSIKGNILMSLYSSHFIKNISTLLRVEEDDPPPDVQFVEEGYLLLASEEGEETLRENYQLQKSVGAEVVLLEPQELSKLYPWLNVEGVKLACLGIKNEGWFDPWSLLSSFKKKVISMGVHYLEGDVTGVTVKENKVQKIKVKMLESGEEISLSCNHLVNATGPWAAKLALMAGVGDKSQPDAALHHPLPVYPQKRCIFVFKCPSGPIEKCPMVIEYTGVYFRREGGMTFITGTSPPKHLDINEDELQVDYSIFEDIIWPKIAFRVPAFENLKVQSAWAGYYEFNTFDQNGIIGPHPIISNLIFVNGFSGHGIQQSPAVGRAISEIIIDGKTHSIDLSEFSFNRIIENRPLREKNII